MPFVLSQLGKRKFKIQNWACRNNEDEKTICPGSRFDSTGSALAGVARQARGCPWQANAVVAGCFIVRCGVGMLGGCSGVGTSAGQIQFGDLVVSVMEQGTVESSNNTEVKCQVRGYSTVIQVVDGGTIVEPGDELVLLDTKRLEDEIGKATTDAHSAKADLERSKADVANAEIAIDAYLKGTYLTHLEALEKQLAMAEAEYDTAHTEMGHAEAMFRRGYVNQYDIQSKRFSLEQAELGLKVCQTAIDVLNNYTKEMRLETLRGNLRAGKAKLQADIAGLAMDEGRRDRVIGEKQYCVIRAKRGGLVIFPLAEAWKERPDIAAGATVRKDQVLLLMPDLSQMQVKVGIHEALVDRVQVGQTAVVTLPDFSIEGEVVFIASVAKPAGWWTGNMVKYDTVIKIPASEDLKPGMSAEIEVVLSEYKNVLLVPVSAVVETGRFFLCWVKNRAGEIEQRVLTLGDSDDVFIVVKSGLSEGDNVLLNPLDWLEEAQREAFRDFEPSGRLSEDTDGEISGDNLPGAEGGQGVF